MQSSSLGLIEMALVFALGLGWGVFELLSLRRGAKPAAPPPGDEKPAPGTPHHRS